MDWGTDPGGLAQETLRLLWNQIAVRGLKLPNQAATKAYVRTVMMRLVYSQGRRRALMSVEGSDESLALLASPEGAPDQGMLAGELSVELRDTLELLPHDERQVIVLRHFEGLGHDEISARLGRTRLASRALLRRAMSRLRELLQE